MRTKQGMAALLAFAGVIGIAACSSKPALSENAALDACERAALETHRIDYAAAHGGDTLEKWLTDWGEPKIKAEKNGAYLVDVTATYRHWHGTREPFDIDVSCVVEQDGTAHVARNDRSAVEQFLVDKCSDKLDAEHTSKEGAFYINDAEFHRDDDGRYIRGSASYFYTDDSGEDEGEYTCRFNDKREITDTSVEWK